MWRQLPNAENMSEFVSGRHGTCGELATLAATHCIDPSRWPMTAAALEEVTAYALHHGSNASGAETMGTVVGFLQSAGYRATRSDPLALHDLLRQWAGVKPIIVEWGLGGKLPGDEPGVHFHFTAILAGDPLTDTYGAADGDNWAVRRTNTTGPLALYTWGNLQAAQPYAVTILEDPPMLDIAQPDVSRYFNAVSASRWQCSPTGHTVRDGMLDYYRTLPSFSPLAGLYELGLPLSDEQPVPGAQVVDGVVPTYQLFECGVRIYDPHHVVDPRPGGYGDIYPAHANLSDVLRRAAAVNAVTVSVADQLREDSQEADHGDAEQATAAE